MDDAHVVVKSRLAPLYGREEGNDSLVFMTNNLILKTTDCDGS